VDKVLFIFGVSLITIGVVSGVQDSMKAEYERGVVDGMNALNVKQVDNMCIKWWVNSNLTAAKKRVCGK
jgi:hypothetical protein